MTLLGERLKPTAPIDPEKLERWVTDLESEKFAVLERACQELTALGAVAAPALRRAVAKTPPLEVRLRIGQLLDSQIYRPLSGEPLRLVRAIAVLEGVDTPESRQLLQALAKGAPGAWLTEEANAACRRLALR